MGGPADPARGHRLWSRPVIGWVLFDLASTIFAFVVLTRYFNDWIVTERRQPDVVIGLMLAAVSLTLVAVLPALGTVADRTGRHRPLLVAAALLSVAGTAALSMTGSVILALVVAWATIVAFQIAQAQYHPLLASVAAPDRRALVSGLGVGLGFVGTLTALIVVGGQVEEGRSQSAFLPAAGLYLTFALPCLLWVRDRPRGVSEAPTTATPAAAAGTPLRALAASLRRAAGAPYGRLLAARFLYIVAVATAIMFLTVYARRTGELSGDDVDRLFLFSTPFAIVGAVGAGLVARRLGARRVLLIVLVAAAGALGASGQSGAAGRRWVAGPVVALALGALTATDRAFLLSLVPAQRRGEGFGLYALIGNLSTGFGPLVLWGGTIYLLHDALAVAGLFAASRVAVCVLAASALTGALLVRRLPAGHPPPGLDTGEPG